MDQPVRTAKAAGRVSFAVLVSRILGLVRDQVFAKLFGAGLYNDAWLVAFRIPNLLRDLFAEGALSSAFIPTFTDFLHRKGKAEAWLLANLVMSGLMILLGLFTVVLLIVPEWFVYLLAAGFSDVPGKAELTATLVRILSPFLVLVAMASVAMGVLNTFNHFFIPALAPALFNVAVIVCGLFLAPQFEKWGVQPIHAMAVGGVAGGVLQYAIQLPLLWRQGYRFHFRFNFAHPGVFKIARLMAPVVLGVSAVQINVLVNTQIASFLEENGPVSWLSYAFRIIYLPIGLFGVAVGVVNLREVSVFAARNDWTQFKKTVADSIKLVSLMAVPSTVGLMVLAVPIVAVLFERGDFTRRDTLHTAYALVCYSLGLFAYSCMKIYVPTFYALNDTRTPVRISLIAVASNLSLNLLLVFVVLPHEYRYTGLAMGTALSVTLSNILLAKSFRARLGGLGGHGVPSTLLKTITAALVMGGVVFLVNQFFQSQWDGMSGLQEIASLTFCIVVGVVVYLVCCRVLRVEEMQLVFYRLRQ